MSALWYVDMLPSHKYDCMFACETALGIDPKTHDDWVAGYIAREDLRSEEIRLAWAEFYGYRESFSSKVKNRLSKLFI